MPNVWTTVPCEVVLVWLAIWAYLDACGYQINLWFVESCLASSIPDVATRLWLGQA